MLLNSTLNQIIFDTGKISPGLNNNDTVGTSTVKTKEENKKNDVYIWSHRLKMIKQLPFAAMSAYKNVDESTVHMMTSPVSITISSRIVLHGPTGQNYAIAGFQPKTMSAPLR